VLEFGLSFRYDLNASDPSGILQYSVNNTAYFNMDLSGVLTNSSTLPVGVYWLQVQAYDPYYNYCFTNIKITVQDTTPPSWVVVPADQVLDAGKDLQYQLRASDLSGISAWTVNDTMHFSISSSGLLTSASPLPAGRYGLLVTVYDAHNNPRTATFSVTVQATTPPPIPGFPLAAVALGAVLGFSVAMVARRQRRKTCGGFIFTPFSVTG
jgi:hypothetical protein